MEWSPKDHFEYLVRLADTNLVLGHRMSEWLGEAPVIEEELALANIGLDLIGQARSLYARAIAVNPDGRDEDDLVFLRDTHEYRNFLLVERENGDFAVTMVRQALYSIFAHLQWEGLTRSADTELAAIASKAVKESAYHVRHSCEWLIRLGDGTGESHERTQKAVDDLWFYTGEMFASDDIERAAIAAGVGVDPAALKPQWDETVSECFAQATLERPADGWMIDGGREGRHTEHLGHLLAEMQFLQRAYPGQKW